MRVPVLRSLTLFATLGASVLPAQPGGGRRGLGTPAASATPAIPASRPAGPKIGGAYSEQGPGPLLLGQAEGMTTNPVVGAVEALAAHPTDSSTLWAGAVNGGIWKTTSALASPPTWTNQTPSYSSLSIAALEVDPTDPTGSTLCAGNGARSSYAGIGGSDSGVLRTTDGGTTWLATGGLAGYSISGLAPRGTVVVAAVRSPTGCSSAGIWRSTDSGATFTQISNTAALPCGRTYDLASDPLNPSHLFTALSSASVASDNGIWRSTDTGSTWTKLTTPLDATFSSTTASRVELAVGRRGTAGSGGADGANVFFAFCPSSSGALSGLYGSTDAGASWSAHDLPSTPDDTSMGLHPGGQCSLHLSIAADPAVHSAVYVGGDRQPWATEASLGSTYFPNSVGALNYTGRLFRSDFALAPGSQTYPVTHCSSALPGCGGAARTASSSAPHADSREMVFLPNGHLVEADDGGVYRNPSPNASTGNWVEMIGNLSVGEQHSTAWDPVSGIVTSGNQDTGSGEQSATGSTSWTTRKQGDGGDVAVGRDDPVVGQSTRYFSSQFLGSFSRRVYTSANAFVSSAVPSLTPLAGAPAISAQFYTPVVVNSVAPARVVLGGANGAYESLDRGDSISRLTTVAVNTAVGGGGPTMVYGVNGNADALYFAQGTSVLVRTAAPPTAPTTTTPGGGSVRALTVDPDDALHAFAVTATAVFRTTNGGSTWSDVTKNIGTFGPGTYRSAAYVPGTTDDLVVVGADRGAYTARVSLLGGATPWDTLGTGLPNAPVFEVAYDLPGDTLIAGTLGRGAFKLTGLQVLTPVQLIWLEAE